MRVLESSVKNGKLTAQQDETDIFIYRGYQFPFTKILITNVGNAFIGCIQMMDIYQHTSNQKYRFFSYGDAMLLEKNNDL
ncbi:S-adenosylmethionine:tRNA ribosyltransferase-isomerase [Abyssogena phaseoliformis symbiont]|uniref:S-adenosylmethionine:tRNA ribosyltransferase-isomerase n=1 Tax=Abyssogena phaseoliformis symbiont TaxID=596095 RepID=UPI003CC94C1A